MKQQDEKKGILVTESSGTKAEKRNKRRETERKTRKFLRKRNIREKKRTPKIRISKRHKRYFGNVIPGSESEREKINKD